MRNSGVGDCAARGLASQPTVATAARRSLWRDALSGGVLGLVATGILTCVANTEATTRGDSHILTAIVYALFLVPVGLLSGVSWGLARRHAMAIPILRQAGIAFAFFFSVPALLSGFSAWSDTRRYQREGRQVEGRVLEAHPEDHDRLLVSYLVAGVDHRVRSAGPQPARSYQVGQVITVYYYASAPADGFCREPNWSPGLFATYLLVAGGILPLWLVGLGGSLVAKFQAFRGSRLSPAP